MAQNHTITSKRVKINKAQATMVGIISGCVFVSVFSLVSARALWNQRSYQARVIGKKEAAVSQLEQNIDNVNTLVTTYKEFTGSPENILGGNPAGTGEKDGDNARIILDALPSKYDFPGLTSSMEKVLEDKKLGSYSITGTDDELNQNKSGAPASTDTVEIPFQISAASSYTGIQDIIGTFEKSIRPLKLKQLTMSGNANDMNLTMTVNTYYQPVKTLNIKTEAVK